MYDRLDRTLSSFQKLVFCLLTVPVLLTKKKKNILRNTEKFLNSFGSEITRSRTTSQLSNNINHHHRVGLVSSNQDSGMAQYRYFITSLYAQRAINASSGFHFFEGNTHFKASHNCIFRLFDRCLLQKWHQEDQSNTMEIFSTSLSRRTGLFIFFTPM